MAITFEHRTLPNGLTIVAEVDRAAHTAAAGFFVKTGARDEPAPLMGVSHFLEHMMFKGTETLSAERLNRAFDDLGARNNAYTSHEITCFYAQVLPDFAEKACSVLAEMMRPALREQDFTTEKGVILEEIAMYMDQPFWVLYEQLCEKHFGSHPMGHRVLGTNQSITDLTRDQMAAYFNDRYSADNTIVALAGNIDFPRLVDRLSEWCGSWPTTGPARDNAPPPISGERLDIRSDKVSRAYMLALANGPAIADERRYAAALAAQILGGADNSRLHWALIETGKAEEAQASYDPHDGFGQFFVYASGEPDRADDIWATVETEIANLRGSLEQQDLDKLKAKYATAVTVGGERPGDRMQRLGRLWSYLGEYRPLEDELTRIQAITLDDVRAILDEFPLSPRTTGFMLPAD